MANDIKQGDTVRLKSGGPLMTVDVISNGEAWCEWFDDKKEPRSRGYKLHVLEKDDGVPVVG